jgi:hypothetical protein
MPVIWAAIGCFAAAAALLVLAGNKDASKHYTHSPSCIRSHIPAAYSILPLTASPTSCRMATLRSYAGGHHGDAGSITPLRNVRECITPSGDDYVFCTFLSALAMCLLEHDRQRTRFQLSDPNGSANRLLPAKQLERAASKVLT